MDQIFKKRLENSEKLLRKILFEKAGLRLDDFKFDDFSIDVFGGKVVEYSAHITYKVYSDALIEDISYNADKVFQKIQKTLMDYTIAKDGRLVPKLSNPDYNNFNVGGMVGLLKYSISDEIVEVSTDFY
jgi:hypothetical protein